MKNIITNKINISDCKALVIYRFKNSTKYEYWCTYHCSKDNSLTSSHICKDNPNCYYKQWKRAEQKLEQLENKECVYGGDNCYKSMLDIITDGEQE